MSAPAWAASLAWALLDFVWQGALVGCVAAALLGLMARARPQWRYLVACGALLLCAALPLIGMLARLGADVAQPMAGGAAALAVPVTAAGAGQGSMLAALPAMANWRQLLQPRLPLVILCWSAGSALMAMRLLLGLAWVRRRSRPEAYLADPAWQAVLDRLTARMGIARKVVLGLVDDLASPVTAGCLRPLVLVPASLATGMAPQLLEALLAHELAHVRRHDYLVNLLQSVIEVLLFYHPVVWWLSHRIRVERELSADDLAASALGEPRRLALALSELDLFQLATPRLAHGANGGDLMSRIKRLVRPQAESASWKLALPVLGLVLSAAAYAHIDTAQAAQAAPAVQKTVPIHRSATESGKQEAYALVTGDGQNDTMTGNSGDWAAIKQVKARVQGDFLWFRDGGKAWIVQDPATLARVRAAWEPVNRLGAQMNAHGEEMNKHGAVMNELGQQMAQAATQVQPDQARMQALQREMDDLGRQMAALGRKIGGATDGERERLQGQMSALGAKMSTLGQQIGEAGRPASQRSARANMDEVGRRMAEAGKPMDALGKKMDVLGKQMDKEGRAADKAVRGLIQEAMAKGLAQPAPGQA